MPVAANEKGRVYQIKKVDSDVSALIVNADSGAGETVDGQPTVSTTTQYQSFTVVSDGTNWWII